MCWSDASSGKDSMPNHGCVGWLARAGVDARLLRQAAAVELVEVPHRVAVLAAQQPAGDRVEDAHQQGRARPAVGHHEDVVHHHDLSSGRPSWNPAADCTPTTARSWSSARSLAPA